MHTRLYRKLVEKSSDVLATVDRAGKITYVSPSVEDVLGYDPAEMVGEPVYEYSHPDDGTSITTTVERVRASGSDTETVELRARRTDGSWCWVEATVQNRIADDDIEGFVLSVREIPGRRAQTDRFQSLAREYRTLLETVTDGIFLVRVESGDGERRFTFERVNRAYEEQTGLTTDEMRGQTPKAVFGQTVGAELCERYSRCADAREPITYQEEVPVETDARFWQTSLAPVVTGERVTKIVGITRDITDRVGRERRLKDQRRQLDEFAGVVSHDLRNPLGVAKGRLELLGDEVDNEHLQPIGEALDRMEELISDTLVLARQGAVIAEETTVSLAELLDTCWAGVDTRDAALVVEGDPTIRGDESRLQHVFENLVRNAVEHGGSAVTVRAGRLGDDGFYLEDTGPGLAGDPAELFDAGYSSAEDGTGFGLTIVRQIAEAHGWNVEATDGADGGARFEFTGVEVVSDDTGVPVG
ncbi:MAG: PAS sensor histidine kinase [halophilic archaeon J07HB67]|jgi:PAS domain S-box|nr:MAG: PAS sensor histidine kinase [halophilic archaeon J07HB67]